MLGTLLARQGVSVTVLEKHADFLRDFRGDTVHPSTIEIMHELGWANEFLKLPHRRMERVTMGTPAGPVTVADFRHLPVRSPYVAFMPQWDFLDFLADKASQYDAFRLIRRAEATDLILADGQVVGVRAETADGPLDVHAELVVSAEGRDSRLREVAGLKSVAVSPGIDVFWFRMSRRPDEVLPFFQNGRSGALIAVDRGEYWQLAYVFAKGGADAIRADGVESFRERIAVLLPQLSNRLAEVTGFDDVHLLSVRIDRLTQWYRPGLLFIGDAAHAMSPAGGVGINLAIQDAVAAARLIGRHGVSTEVLAKIQRRRTFPAAVTQRFQAVATRSLYADSSSGSGTPAFARILRSAPALARLTGRFIGLGVRPEHIS
jgi:2-polyprenyl-6-methoxyphenol hydroxylase-like FAD-dependent oxidoreductase